MYLSIQRLEERYAKRRMEQESSTYIRIFNWKDDKICLLYPEQFQSWKVCHMNDDEVILHICLKPGLDGDEASCRMDNCPSNFLNQVHASHILMRTGLLKSDSVRTSVCLCACMCVSTPNAFNN